MFMHAELVVESTVMPINQLVDPVLTREHRRVLRDLIKAQSIEKDCLSCRDQKNNRSKSRDLDNVPLQVISVEVHCRCSHAQKYGAGLYTHMKIMITLIKSINKLINRSHHVHVTLLTCCNTFVWLWRLQGMENFFIYAPNAILHLRNFVKFLPRVPRFSPPPKQRQLVTSFHAQLCAEHTLRINTASLQPVSDILGL